MLVPKSIITVFAAVAFPGNGNGGGFRWLGAVAADEMVLTAKEFKGTKEAKSANSNATGVLEDVVNGTEQAGSLMSAAMVTMIKEEKEVVAKATKDLVLEDEGLLVTTNQRALKTKTGKGSKASNGNHSKGSKASNGDHSKGSKEGEEKLDCSDDSYLNLVGDGKCDDGDWSKYPSNFNPLTDFLATSFKLHEVLFVETDHFHRYFQFESCTDLPPENIKADTEIGTCVTEYICGVMPKSNCRLDEGTFYPFHSCADLGFQRLLEVAATEQDDSVIRVCVRHSNQVNMEDPDFCKAMGLVEEGWEDYGEFCVPDGKVLDGKQESCALKGFVDHIKIPNSEMEDFDICFKLASQPSSQAVRRLHSSICPALPPSSYEKNCDDGCKLMAKLRDVTMAAAGNFPTYGFVLGPLIGWLWEDPTQTNIDAVVKDLVDYVDKRVEESIAAAVDELLNVFKGAFNDEFRSLKNAIEQNQSSQFRRDKLNTLVTRCTTLRNFFTTGNPSNSLLFSRISTIAHIGTTCIEIHRTRLYNYTEAVGEPMQENEKAAIEYEYNQNLEDFIRAAQSTRDAVMQWRRDQIRVEDGYDGASCGFFNQKNEKRLRASDSACPTAYGINGQLIYGDKCGEDVPRGPFDDLLRSYRTLTSKAFEDNFVSPLVDGAIENWPYWRVERKKNSDSPSHAQPKFKTAVSGYHRLYEFGSLTDWAQKKGTNFGRLDLINFPPLQRVISSVTAWFGGNWIWYDNSEEVGSGESNVIYGIKLTYSNGLQISFGTETGARTSQEINLASNERITAIADFLPSPHYPEGFALKTSFVDSTGGLVGSGRTWDPLGKVESSTRWITAPGVYSTGPVKKDGNGSFQPEYEPHVVGFAGWWHTVSLSEKIGDWALAYKNHQLMTTNIFPVWVYHTWEHQN